MSKQVRKRRSRVAQTIDPHPTIRRDDLLARRCAPGRRPGPACPKHSPLCRWMAPHGGFGPPPPFAAQAAPFEVGEKQTLGRLFGVCMRRGTGATTAWTAHVEISIPKHAVEGGQGSDIPGAEGFPGRPARLRKRSTWAPAASVPCPRLTAHGPFGFLVSSTGGQRKLPRL